MTQLLEKSTQSAGSAQSAWSAVCSLHGLRFGVTRFGALGWFSLDKQTGMVDDFEDFFKGKSRCS